MWKSTQNWTKLYFVQTQTKEYNSNRYYYKIKRLELFVNKWDILFVNVIEAQF